jgi:hypothetical protein
LQQYRPVAVQLQVACQGVQVWQAAAASTLQVVDQQAGDTLTAACCCAAASDPFKHDSAESRCATVAGVPRVWLG